MSMYVRLHRGQTVDAVIPSAVGQVPTSAPSDVVLAFPSDINPSKTIQVTENVQATDHVTGALLYNADGTPQWETQTVTNPDGTTSEQIVTQQVNKTVTLLESPSSFVLADLSGYTIVGSAAHQQKLDIAALRAGYEQTLLEGFNVTIGTTQYTFGWQTEDEANLNAVQTSIDKAFMTFPVQYADIHGNPVSIPDQATLSSLEQTASKFAMAQHQQVLYLIGQVQAGTEGVTWTPAGY